MGEYYDMWDIKYLSQLLERVTRKLEKFNHLGYKKMSQRQQRLKHSIRRRIEISEIVQISKQKSERRKNARESIDT